MVLHSPRHEADYRESQRWNPKWMEYARNELGVTEAPGAVNNNPEVTEYIKEAGFNFGDETPWCSAFVNWVMRQYGYSRTNHLGARSWLQWGSPMTAPLYGAIAVLTRTSATNPNAGHVGFLVRQQGPNLLIPGGNQSNKVSVAPYAKSRLLGYRWPLEVHLDPRHGAPRA